MSMKVPDGGSDPTERSTGDPLQREALLRTSRTTCSPNQFRGARCAIAIRSERTSDGLCVPKADVVSGTDPGTAVSLKTTLSSVHPAEDR